MTPERISAERYCQFLTELGQLGVPVGETGSATQSLTQLRAMYEPFLAALAGYFRFDLPEIVPAQTTADNWQRSPWIERAPGIGTSPRFNRTNISARASITTAWRQSAVGGDS